MILEIQNSTLGYSNNAILKAVSCGINQGDICVILGKNGSGKSTLIKSILKDIPLISGKMYINSEDFSKFNYEELSKKIAVVYSQNKLESKVNVYDLVALGRYPYKKWYEKLNKYDKNCIEKAIKYCGIGEMLHKNADELSDGNLQKVFIARAIAQDTPILILDEPLSHLDIENQFSIMKIFNSLAKNEQKSVLFTSHEWDLSLTVANKLWYIKNDTLLSGLVEDIAIKSSILQDFSNSDYEFNFNLNKYVHKVDNKHLNNVCVMCSENNDEQIYWLIRALRKNNITLNDHAEIKIFPSNGKYILEKNFQKIEYNSIEKLLESIIIK